MFKTALLSLALAAAACGGKGAPSGGVETTPKPEASASAVVELGEVTIYEGKDVMARIHADGTTELGTTTDEKGASSFQPGPVIKPDGSFADKSGTDDRAVPARDDRVLVAAGADRDDRLRADDRGAAAEARRDGAGARGRRH